MDQEPPDRAWVEKRVRRPLTEAQIGVLRRVWVRDGLAELPKGRAHLVRLALDLIEAGRMEVPEPAPRAGHPPQRDATRLLSDDEQRRAKVFATSVHRMARSDADVQCF